MKGWMIAVLVGALAHGALAEDLGKRLAGDPFSDPARLVPKPEEWVARPIAHAEWGQDADLAVALDQHLYPALLPLTEAFARERHLRIAVREGTCGFSEGMLNNKAVEITGLCCPPGATDRLPGLRFHTLGIAALAILVPEDNPFANLTGEQVRHLFMGRPKSWGELPPVAGLAPFPVPVQPVTRLHCPLKPGHWRVILDNESQFTARKVEIKEIPDYIAKIASTKGSIGYEVLWNQERYQGRTRLKAIKVDGHHPADAEAVIRRRYPFYTVYTMTTWARDDGANPVAADLIRYYREHFDRTLAEEYHIIPATRLKEAGWRFRDEELVGEP